jgi:hypothetical protein
MESADPKVSLTAPSAEATRVRDHLASGGARTVRELASELGVSVGSISGMLDAGVVKVAQAPSARRCEKCNTPSETALCPSCRARLAAGGTLTRPASTGSEARVPTRHMATSLTGPPQEIVDAGSLHIEGSIGPGWRVRAGFDLTVGGQVERAEIEAGAGALRLDAPCRQSEIRAGHLRDLNGRLIAALADADRDLTALAGSAEALQQTATLRGQRLPLAVAVGALVKDRWADLADRLDAGSSLVAHERLRRPAVPETLLKALDGARDALADPSDIGLLRSRARALAGELATVRAGQGAPPRSIVDSLTECSADIAGALAVRGSGVHACELTVGGDLVLGGRNGSLGGHVCVHGKVVAPRIRGGTRLELPGGEGGLCLRADMVGAGVEITVAGKRIPFAKETRGVVIRVEPSGPVVETA